MRRLLVLACLMLAGCWVGGDFYPAEAVRAPVPPGDYAIAGFGEMSSMDIGRVRISIRPDQTTQILPISEDGNVDQGDMLAFAFAPIEGHPNLYVGWMTEQFGQRTPSNSRLYAVLQREGEKFRLLIPPCEGEGRASAQSAGGQARTEGGMALCEFSDRRSLETALIRGFPHFADGVRLTPIPSP